MLNSTFTFRSKLFTLTQFLGKGKSGYSYLMTNGDEFYVLKKIHHEPIDYYQFGNKIEAESYAYTKLKEIGMTVPELHMIDLENEFLIKEFIDGELASQLISEEKIEDRDILQLFTFQELGKANNIQIDYFPSNFIRKNKTWYYIDYECNPYSNEWNFTNWGIYFWLNSEGMTYFIETGSTEKLIDPMNGKPFTQKFEREKNRYLDLFLNK